MSTLVRLIGIMCLLSSCAHSVHHYAATDYSKKIRTNSKKVSAMQEQTVIFYFSDNTDYVDAAYQEIQDKCPGKEVSGINTRFSTSLGFFSWTNKFRVDAYCI